MKVAFNQDFNDNGNCTEPCPMNKNIGVESHYCKQCGYHHGLLSKVVDDVVNRVFGHIECSYQHK